MGLSVAFGGGIMMIVLVSTLMSLPTTLDMIASHSDVSSEKSALEDNILKTDIIITSISAVNATSDVSFYLKNEGTEKLWLYDKFTLIVTYDGSSGKKTEQKVYKQSCPSTTITWCINQFVNDHNEQEILNTDESMEIKTTVSTNIADNGVVIVVIATDNGVVATKSIQV